jgi:predicted ArsR family transcriptional regulator
VRSGKVEESPVLPAASRDDRGLLRPGPSYLQRLGILYREQIRLTIVTELYMREMSVRQFFETIGGTSYDSVRRHFLRLVEFGWLRPVRTERVGRGRPEKLYRSTELAVIDTETWRALPFSIRDAFTIQLLEEMASRLGGALENGTADARADRVATFKALDNMDEQAWRKAHDAVETCFQTLLQEQIDAEIRLEHSHDQSQLVVVNLAAFETPNLVTEGDTRINLPKAEETVSSPPWPERIGKVFADRLDLAIIAELNRASMTPAQLHAALGGAALGGTSSQGMLRRCKRLTHLGWAVNVNTQTGGPLYGASVYSFRAAIPNVSESDITEKIPLAARHGSSWEAFQKFIATAMAAVDAGTFNHRFDRHLTMSPMLVDEIGCRQVAKALQRFDETLIEVGAFARRTSKSDTNIQAGFLLSSFQAPLR